MALILASASPQRKTLLQEIGVSFQAIPSSIDENACDEENPGKRTEILALLKARDVHASHKNDWVLGCDTLVEAHDGTILEKPVDANDAKRMIALQSGKISHVHSALALISPDGSEHVGLSTSHVRFATLDSKTIDEWTEKGLWKDRSGAFQIDGSGQMLIEHLEGDWTGVVGLPVFLFGQLCTKAGLAIT